MSKVPNWFYNQSGVIPFRIENKIIEILLITSRSGKRWVIPKGVIENSLKPYESAGKEAIEEAGIKGKIYKKPVGIYTYRKWGGVCTVKVYPLLVEKLFDEWEEDYRKRKWFIIENAVKKIKEKELATIINQLPAFI